MYSFVNRNVKVVSRVSYFGVRSLLFRNKFYRSTVRVLLSKQTLAFSLVPAGGITVRVKGRALPVIRSNVLLNSIVTVSFKSESRIVSTFVVNSVSIDKLITTV